MSIKGYDPKQNKYECLGSSNSCDIEDMFNTVEYFQAMVNEKDSNAVSLGYKADATKVDRKKFPKYAAGQNCGNCQLFRGKAGAESGGCSLFEGEQVSAKGWCSEWVKKA